MTWGVGIVLFYTLMATKYPLYTFVSLVPFSAIGAMGVMKLIRKGKSRALKWIIVGPTLLLWLAYVAGTFFAPWGFYFLLYVVVAIAVTTYASCMVYKKRLSFSHYYRPWYDGDILYRCCRRLRTIY